MKKVISLLVLVMMFSGCTAATWELIYSDAKVVYKDAKYVVHELKQAKEGK